jgi:hypothetical protein
MQRRTGFALRPAIAAFTIAASAIALAGASEAAPEDACLKAPRGVAPQGKHWYYRTERPSMRKCWYLAEKGLTVTQRVAARTTPQAGTDEEPDAPATVASVPAAPAADVQVAPATNVSPAPVASVPAAPAAEPPTPVITTLTTRNVSNEIQSVPDPAQAAAPVSTLAERFPSDRPTPAAVAEQPPTAAAARELASVTTEPMSTLQWLLGAIALTGFLASGVFLIMALLRRRSDVLSLRRETDALPFEESPEMAAEEEGPRFEPLQDLVDIVVLTPRIEVALTDRIERSQRLARRRRAA